ncbi:unnamed protein product [Adineta steineri]|uniref:Uncharacterized protein n=2 Tax=Adineta steineri TaxID=433720 RepID=A0A814DZX8_9BILA|nr:unnamed protein product [Adineta steineri]
MANSTQAPSISNYDNLNSATFQAPANENPPVLQALSADDVQKMKYKIDLDKQVTEKQQRLAREWENKIERDKKYVQHTPFGRHNRTTIFNKRELEEILTKGRAPSPVLEMPLQYSLHHQPHSTETYIPNENNLSKTNGSSQQPIYDNHPQYPVYSSTQPQPSNTNFDFQRFYEPGNLSNPNGTSISTSQSTKGDVHDPFSSYDPNKEGQNAFNSIPQQDLYDPWGRPGAGAPLVHASTGQKFTRYSGSLQDKQHRTGPLGYHQVQYIHHIEDQKRDAEPEQTRRQQEDIDRRSNTSRTADWNNNFNKINYPTKFQSPSTETPREKFIDTRARHRSEDKRVLYGDLIQQAEERARLQKLSRRENSLAELQHTVAMNNWWGRGGSGAPAFTVRRHNVQNSFENPRQKWVTNHLGQLVAADDDPSNRIQIQSSDFYYPKNKQYSSHRNNYEIGDD